MGANAKVSKSSLNDLHTIAYPPIDYDMVDVYLAELSPKVMMEKEETICKLQRVEKLRG